MLEDEFGSSSSDALSSTIRWSNESIVADKQCFNLNSTDLTILLNKLLTTSSYRDNARHLASLLHADGGTPRAIQLIRQWITMYNQQNHNFTSTLRIVSEMLNDDRYRHHQILATELLAKNNMFVVIPIIMTMVLILAITLTVGCLYRVCCHLRRTTIKMKHL
jgi:hypothetical protein